ncbi:nucleobase-ascorbate transporter 6-like protein [Tanacetum coccineum]
MMASTLVSTGAIISAINKPDITQVSCRTDRARIIVGAPWIRVPYPFQWGAPTFDAGEAFAMMVASFVSLVESTGAFIAVARYASATPMPPLVLSRGISWQVLAY